MLNPWIPALLVGLATLVTVIVALFMIFFTEAQSQALTQLAEGATFSSLEDRPANTAWVQDALVWLLGACVLVTALTYGVQWLRRERAWREYEELRIGINDRIAAALDRQEQDT